MNTLSANGGKPAADGSPFRRQLSVNGGKRQQGMAGKREVSFSEATYSVAAAAALLAIPERTLREWIRLGKVTAAAPRPGERGSRIPAAVLEELRQTRGGDEHLNPCSGEETAAAGGNFWQAAADSSGKGRQTAAEMSPPDSSSPLVESLQQHIETLTAQLEARAQAEAELRRLLLMSQQQLTAALERPMLPAISTTVEKPARVRWWWPFGRKV